VWKITSLYMCLVITIPDILANRLTTQTSHKTFERFTLSRDVASWVDKWPE